MILSHKDKALVAVIGRCFRMLGNGQIMAAVIAEMFNYGFDWDSTEDRRRWSQQYQELRLLARQRGLRCIGKGVAKVHEQFLLNVQRNLDRDPP